MSKRISLKKLGEKMERAKGESSAKKSTLVKGVVIGEKRSRDDPSSSPSKKGKPGDSPKRKEPAIAPEPKKKATRPDECPRATTSSKPGEGSSPSLGTVLGPGASILGSPSIAEKILRGVIPPSDQEKVGQLSLDHTATKFFHVLVQVLPRLCPHFLLVLS